MTKSHRVIADELCITHQNILLRGSRIVLPVKLRERAIMLAHEGHAGMTRCKQRLRAKLWWPHMEKEVEAHIKYCHPCQITALPPRPEPMRPTKLSKQPWLKLRLGIFGPFPTGEYVAVVTDYYYSRWPSVKVFNSVTLTSLLSWLDEVFAEHGYPEETDRRITLHSSHRLNLKKPLSHDTSQCTLTVTSIVTVGCIALYDDFFY